MCYPKIQEKPHIKFPYCLSLENLRKEGQKEDMFIFVIITMPTQLNKSRVAYFQPSIKNLHVFVRSLPLSYLRPVVESNL